MCVLSEQDKSQRIPARSTLAFVFSQNNFMAHRRMTSLDITDTDAFIDMPVSSQALYFHLNARADDDGFVSSPKKIQRMVGAAEDDMKILIAKKFIISFPEGVCVIKHWRINNYIRKDIYKETKYLSLKKCLFIRKNGTYSVNSDDAEAVPSGHFLVENTNVDVASTTRALRKGKVRKGKERLRKRGEFSNVQINEEEHTKLVEKYGASQITNLIEELSQYIESSGKEYKSHYATLLAWAKKKQLAFAVEPTVVPAPRKLTNQEQAETSEKVRAISKQLKENLSQPNK